jgi:AcrR family transcriptional regulator
MISSNPEQLPGQRGRSDHAMRARIVDVAQSRFRREGFAKTSVADIAGELGVTPAYIYKFFASKLAICEAVCSKVVGVVGESMEQVVRQQAPASARLEQLYTVLLKQNLGMHFAERRLYDMVLVAMENRWESIERHKLAIRAAAARLIADGVAAGEFDPALDQEEATMAVWLSLFAFAHPAVLESIQHDFEAHARAAAALSLRALTNRWNK